MRTVGGRALGKDRHRIVAHVGIFDGTLTLLDLIEYLSARFLVLADHSGHEEALEAAAARAKERSVAEVVLGSEARVQWRLDEAHHLDPANVVADDR